MNKNMDIRTFATTIKRDTTDDGTMKISGYGAVFNEPAQAEDFVEYMDPHALDGVDLSSVLLLYAHDSSNILARVDSGSLSVSVDKKGLAFSATLPDTTLGHDTYNNIEAGNIKGCSIGFVIAPDGDTWQQQDGQTTHIIQKIEQLAEISLTPIPAYTETSVQVQRDLEKLQEANNLAEKEPDKTEEPAAQAPVDKSEAPQAPEAAKATEAPKAPAASAPANDDIAAMQKEIDSLTKELKALTDNGASDSSDAADKAEPASSSADSAAPAASEASDGSNAASADAPADDGNDEAPADESDDEGDKKNMAKNLTEANKESIEQRDLESFLKTGKVEHRDSEGFTSVEGEAVLPSEVLDVLKQPDDPAQLSGYVNKIQVNAPTGKLPVLKRATAQLATAEELAQNPQIANASIDKVTYDVNTYRGQLPISMEMAQDFSGISSLLGQYVQTVKNQTEQHQIGAVLATATPVAAKSIDDIKDAFNIGLTNYGSDRMFVISESLYSELDKAKDNDGRYLLQESIASSTGKTLLGAPVVIVPDDVLGKAGDKVGFVGSVKAFVLEAIRANVTLNWTRNEQFEQILGVAFRADFEAADKEAGKFITYAPVSNSVSSATN